MTEASQRGLHRVGRRERGPPVNQAQTSRPAGWHRALRHVTFALINTHQIAAYRPILGGVTTSHFDRITVDPDVLGGKPCIRGLRLSVGMIVQMVAAGKSTAQIVDEYPYLEAEDVRQALAYSAQLAENEYHLVLRSSA